MPAPASAAVAADPRCIALLRFDHPGERGGPLPGGLGAALAVAGFRLQDLIVHRPVEAGPSYAYLFPAPDRRSVTVPAFEKLRDALALHLPSASAARLLAMMELDGVCAGLAPTHHLVVETDVVPSGEAELSAWYDQEHTPGLAAVAGTVRAARYCNLDDGPLFHACYALTSLETLASPAWQALRQTAWTARIRPLFVNLRRTVFEA
jgi:hypothetical protein